MINLTEQEVVIEILSFSWLCSMLIRPCTYAHTYFKINVFKCSKINFIRAKAELRFLIQKVNFIRESDHPLLEEKCLYASIISTG